MHGGAEMEEWMELARPQSLWAEEIPSTSRSGGREGGRWRAHWTGCMPCMRGVREHT